MDEKVQSTYSFHLAGIVPVAGQDLGFGFPWHDSLMPIAQDYLAVEHAVLSCAYAGCETIWVVCHNDMQPLIRHRLGEWVDDPTQYGLPINGEEQRVRVPIFYVPIHPKDRYKKDCLGWSALYGAQSAHFLGKNISKWLMPDKFFVSFPYGIIPLNFIRSIRKKISHQKKMSVTYNGQNIKTGAFLPFTFDAEDYKRCRDIIKHETTYGRDKEGNKIPLIERYSARFFPLEQVFKGYEIEQEFETPWYYDISSWDNLTNFFATNEQKTLAKPDWMRYNEWNPIGKDIND